MKNLDFPWALFNLGETIFGISCEYIKSIFILKEVNAIPDMPDHIKGIFNLRGNIIHIIDLRKLFGMKSVSEEIHELQDMLDQRKNDHINWVSALEESVRDKTEFKLTTDPHACAFGKWYDAYTSDDNMINYLLKKFDEPHRAIHAAAEKVKKLEEAHEYSQAYELINQTKSNELQIMINLFSSFIEEYRASRRELVIVLQNEDEEFGITVDNVLSIEPITESSDTTLDHELLKMGKNLGIGMRQKDDTPIILIKDLCFK